MSVLKVDYTYFYDSLSIPNIEVPEGTDIDSTDTSNVIQMGKVADLTKMITKYDQKFLILVLGKTLYEEFKAGVGAYPAVGSTIEAKWKILLDMLVNRETKESPLANYVFWHYLREMAESTTGIGEVEVEKTVSPIRKQVRVWNEMVEVLREVKSFLEESSDYPSFDPYKDEQLTDVYFKQSWL